MADETISEEDMHTAVLVFAHFIGIDIEHEQHLLHIAYDAPQRRDCRRAGSWASAMKRIRASHTFSTLKHHNLCGTILVRHFLFVK